MMRDTKPEEEAEYLELTAKLDRTPPAAAAAAAPDAGAQETAAPGGEQAEGAMEVEEEEAPVPPPFEVSLVPTFLSLLDAS